MTKPKLLALWASACAALLAWCIGKAMNVPVWRDGWEIGDRTDLACLAFACVWFALRAIEAQGD